MQTNTETDLARLTLSQWCTGTGLDIGFGGAKPIVRTAVCVDREPGHRSRVHFGDQFPTHIIMDAFEDELPFRDNSVDYVYSSHCIEDATDTKAVLTQWCRIIKLSGYLVIGAPDQQAFLLGTGPPNPDHKHPDFSLEFLINCLPSNMIPVHRQYPVPYSTYSFELVAKKIQL